MSDEDIVVDLIETDPEEAPSVKAARTVGRLHGRARGARAGNADFLGLKNPALPQVATQVADLTRQVDALIRLVVGGEFLTEDEIEPEPTNPDPPNPPSEGG